VRTDHRADLRDVQGQESRHAAAQSLGEPWREARRSHSLADGLDVVKKIEADGADSGTPKVVHKMTKVTITES